VVGSSRFAAYLTLARTPDDPNVIALLAPGAVRLPIGMCLPDGSLPPAGSTAMVGGGSVRCSGVAWRVARWWDPRPRIERWSLVRGGDRLLQIALGEPASSFGLPSAEGIEVAGALARGDPRPAAGVIGRGPGLTPAGDDVVAGALAVLDLTGRLDHSIWPVLEARAVTHTTTLSAGLLAAARDGGVIPQAGRLLAALAAGCRPEALRDAAVRLFAVGSTSGRDLCLGMAGALAAVRSLDIEEAA
jgi:hypothetical protein